MYRITFSQRLCALLLLLCASTAHARIDYCVSTTVQLQAAINDAENDGDASLISLKPGSYVLTGDLNYNQGGAAGEGALTLRGGALGTNCSASIAGADGTTIAGLFAATFIQRRGELLIEDLSFVSVDVSVTKLAFALDAVRVQRILMLSAALIINAPSSEVVVRESVFKNGADLFSVSDFGLFINASQTDPGVPESNINLINVSVLDAFARITGVNRALPVRVTNSIFQRTSTELESSANLIVRNSRSNGIQMLGGATLTSSGLTTLATQLNAQYQPLSGSPMLDRGLSGVYEGLPPFDLYGDARVVGAAVDIGGAESPVDGNGVVIVDTTASSGAGSLAAAVTFANTDSAPNTIRFNIPGSTCPKRIARTSALTITDGVVIDGYSQPGSVVPSESRSFNGEPCILLDGANRTHAGIATDAALASNDESITIRGLAFEDFSNAVQLTHGNNHVVQGNQFGGSIGNSSAELASNDRGVFLGTNDCLIGGLSEAQANLIGGGNITGITIAAGADSNFIIGNQIGFDPSGILSTLASNGVGISVNGADNQILGNRIGGNTSSGIAIRNADANRNEIRDNRIGKFVSLGMPGNGGPGISLGAEAHHNQIGPDNRIIDNLPGISISSSAGGSNIIERNSISSNTGLGIDIGDTGVTPNNNDSGICNVTTGCAGNNDQNYPALSSAEFRPETLLVPAALRITGSLRSLVRADPYRIEFYQSASCDPSGFGEGSVYLDSIDVTIANSGVCAANNCTRAFNVPINPDSVAAGDSITAIATASNGDSSEFSACVTVTVNGAENIFANGFE
jgi:hypothetical protein